VELLDKKALRDYSEKEEAFLEMNKNFPIFGKI
jgi:hypothetical protein